ncbi:hypothetical protein CVT26_015807 [Gymnopilus dilepis]|uniref:Uncharacterized protein n=1 Tax=Gymnopilus dilepis TaxID=231916 RepID=A0A409WMJ1_9AGAR|nr:hypothetical protein CVT26_015807 [Gymnopilus dilepis]
MSFSSTTDMDKDDDDDFVKSNFTPDEETYLAEFIPAWRGKFYGDRTHARKGVKKSWVVQIPYAKFVEKFYTDGNLQPQAAMLQHKIYRWFLNRTNDGSNRSPRSRLQRVSPLKKPRATNGFNVFTEEKKEEITHLKWEKSNAAAPADNLSPYKESCKELWDGLSAEYKEEYSRKASERNDLIKKGPTDEDIERNQSCIIQNTLSALSGLTGYHWTGHGDAAFFVMGAHRKMDGKIVTFYGSVLDDDDYASKGFHRTFSNFNGEIAEPFKAWAETVIPVPQRTEMASPQNVINGCPSGALALTSLADGFPVLPDSDFNETTPNDARALLHQFITAAWDHRCRGSECTLPLPWKGLSLTRREPILEEPSPFKDFCSLDPQIASIADTYSILKTILLEQKNGARPFSFIPKVRDSQANMDTEEERSISSDLSNDDTGDIVGVMATQAHEVDFSPLRPRGHRIYNNQPLSSKCFHIFPSASFSGKLSLGDRPAAVSLNGDLGSMSNEKIELETRRRASATSQKRTDQPERNERAKSGRIDRKRASQTRIDDEAESGPPVRQKRKGIHIPKAGMKVQQDASERNSDQLEVDVGKRRSGPTERKTSKRTVGTTLPQRVRSARIRDKKYKNTMVTIPKR